MYRGKKRTAQLILFAYILSLFAIPVAEAAPSVSAQAAAVIDVESGRILYEKQGQEKMRVASLTKIMTAIVAIEEGKLDEMVTVPDYAIGTEGSSIYLRHGEKLTLEHLLYGLMLRSGNDAAVTIADHIGGSLEGFARLMNEKVEYLGLRQTHFTNPHGLDDSNQHFSSAVDMAQISAYALRNEDFRKIVSTKVMKIPQHGEKWDRKLINKNKMLNLYNGADGVKTGYTKLAKRCLVSSATRDGRQIAVVTLNAPDDWSDHSRLLDYGFKQFSRTEIVGEKEPVDTDKGLVTVNSFNYPLAGGEENKIRKVVKMEDGYKEMLPGGVAGYLHIYLGDQQIGRIGLVYSGEERSTSGTGLQVSRLSEILSTLKSLIWGAYKW
ncbi:D-alanyl-D-alanine carboxypeptidase family protein [Ammoniphilus sp. CFH 90114]|uniref:D-alanyl-D-alanine carboxypeptidase family protein n=1 Tax=Ammoniphilus sp. CFH 90114 TaxID=2493665 RepID=UPI00100E84AA|nr:D-alanyl-D-alanine carboxypeptidase family protein [Ammoniphilus sp. CFH 90114]RXT13849.1 D-alanyl-D-alanine carboxypeptidase [Ammoniphilus sp. CFH 90114]